jgi:hypothetical protein
MNLACGRRALEVGAPASRDAGQAAGAGTAGRGGSVAGAPGGSAGVAGGLGGSAGAAGAPDAAVVTGLKKIGEPCAERIDCESALCENGVCCAMSCDGVCWSCSLPGSLGNCEPVPLDTQCASVTCNENSLARASTCDGLGTCLAPPLEACAPFACDAQAVACRTTCTSDADCSDATCVDGLCGVLIGRDACTSNDECASGFCTDGVCCNEACQGACVSCDLPNQSGTCAPIEAGDPDPRGVCVDRGAASCGTMGACDGHGACGLYAGFTVCAPATCTGDTLTPESFCDGLGTCVPSHSESCSPVMCSASGAQCADDCPGGDAICVSGAYCSGNEQCTLRKAGGAPCGSDHECVSMTCVSGADGGPPSCASPL